MGPLDQQTHAQFRRMVHPNSAGTQLLHSDPPVFTLCTSSSGCSSVFFIIANKLANVNKMFPWVLLAMLANCSTWSSDSRNLWFLARLDRHVGNLGTHCLWLASEVRDRPLDLSLFICGVCPNSGHWYRMELSCRTPSWCLQKMKEFLGVQHPHIWHQKCCEWRNSFSLAD